MTKKWVTLSALLAGGAMLLTGCLGSFWQGLWNTGWPADNQWMNIAIDVANEAIFG